jgi:hypothetical protein
MRTRTPIFGARTGAALRFLLSAATVLSAVFVLESSPHRSPVPHAAPPSLRAFLPRHHHAPRIDENRTANSSNWAGYVVKGSDFRHVIATWQVPTVQPGDASHPDTYSAVWVGVDGDNSKSVEQCGTEHNYVDGQAQYAAWFEIYPSPFNVTLDPTGYPVAPGDFITAEVKYLGKDQFFLSLTSSQGWAATTTQTYPGAQRSSVEWIVEAPSTARGQVLALANFGQASLSGCEAATGSASLIPIGSFAASSLDEITMASRTGMKASTGALTGPDLDSFKVLWESH